MEDMKVKLEELKSLLLIMSRGLETSEESFKAKDVSNMLSILYENLHNIISKLD